MSQFSNIHNHVKYAVQRCILSHPNVIKYLIANDFYLIKSWRNKCINKQRSTTEISFASVSMWYPHGNSKGILYWVFPDVWQKKNYTC